MARPESMRSVPGAILLYLLWIWGPNVGSGPVPPSLGLRSGVEPPGEKAAPQKQKCVPSLQDSLCSPLGAEDRVAEPRVVPDRLGVHSHFPYFPGSPRSVLLLPASKSCAGRVGAPGTRTTCGFRAQTY